MVLSVCVFIVASLFFSVNIYILKFRSLRVVLCRDSLESVVNELAADVVSRYNSFTFAQYFVGIDEKLRIGSEPVHYSFDVDFSTDMTVDLKFQLGNIGESASAGAHQVTLSNIQWS